MFRVRTVADLFWYSHGPQERQENLIMTIINNAAQWVRTLFDNILIFLFLFGVPRDLDVMYTIAF